MAGRSSIERLPAEILAAVHRAIREGATIDEIVSRIRARGGTCSRSAVTRYVRRTRDVLRLGSAAAGLADDRLHAPGRPEDGTERPPRETLRALAMRAAIALQDSGEPPTVDQVTALVRAMRRIEDVDETAADR